MVGQRDKKGRGGVKEKGNGIITWEEDGERHYNGGKTL